MPFKFADRPLLHGLFEPEGIYLHLPYSGDGFLLERFGTRREEYRNVTYNGVELKGHTGVDFAVMPAADLLAVDDGQIVEISFDQAGLERYIKVTHRWGESLYALIGQPSVDSGHHVGRGDVLGSLGDTRAGNPARALLHFGIRVTPFNRFDGWGGFTDPLNHFSADDLRLPTENELAIFKSLTHMPKDEGPRMRRP